MRVMVEVVNLDGILKELEEEDCLVCIYNRCIEIKGKSAVIRVCRDKLYVSGSGVEIYMKKRLRGAQRGFVDLTFGEVVANEERKREVVRQVVSLVRSLLCS